MSVKNPGGPVVIAGCGYVGARLGRRLALDGARVVGIRRRAAPDLAEAGIEPLPGDLTALPAGAIPVADCLYYLAPPPSEARSDTVLGAFLAALASGPPRRLVYVGTTGIYGDSGGAWIDEGAPLNPATDRARRRVDAEQQLRAFAERHGSSLCLLRVGGIYGPGRLPLDRLRRGEPLLCPQDSPWSNRIHVDDLVGACAAAGRAARLAEVINVVDGHPSTMTDYFYTVADVAGLPRPACVDMAEAERRFSPAMLSYLRESRRIRNDRLMALLEGELRYPQLRAGIGASLLEH